jgi:hypothetical protein
MFKDPMLKNFLSKNRKTTLTFTAAGVLIAGGAAFYFLSPAVVFYIESENKTLETALVYDPHPITGQRCQNNDRRPIAVMLAVDAVTRPLSGIASADLVVEMPAVKGGITRLMGLYICEEPEEIGSIRSSRHDFIPVAGAFDAIYAHWGGSNFALDELSRGVLDNIDAMINPNNAFYRKKGFAAPHDGFTSYKRLYETAQSLGYRTKTNFVPYPRADMPVEALALPKPADVRRSVEGPLALNIGYPVPFNVSYIYNRETNTYKRWRGGVPEMDRLNGEQAEVSVVIVLKTNSRQLNVDYNDVDVSGFGDALIFQNGLLIKAKWERGEAVDSRLRFVNEDGQDVPLTAGKMWISYVDYGTSIQWGNKKL